MAQCVCLPEPPLHLPSCVWRVAGLQAVAVARQHPVYKLRTADMTCMNLSDLAVYNVRRLFANSGEEFMDLRKQRANQSDNNNNNSTGRRRRVANALMEPEPSI
jgi:hypothetical protein